MIDDTGRDARVTRPEAGARPPVLGMRLEAVLFDMDGVVTDTAEAHAAAWKRLFDEYLRTRADKLGHTFHPFDADGDYRTYVDGKPRYDGVASFLRSRGIDLPWGAETDANGAETVCGLGNQKDAYFQAWLDEHRVKTFPGTLAFISALKSARIKTAVFSASRNAEAVLRSADALDLFDVRMDGRDLARLGLPGKPDPALLRATADRLHVSPGSAAIVEDAIAGIEAGIAGGFRLVVGIDRGRNADALTRAGAHLVIHDASELAVQPDGGVTIKTLWSLPLADERRDALRARLAGKTVAAFLDYDGTLTPIVEDYTKAFLSEAMRATLAGLGKHCTVAVVTGRDVDVVRRLVKLESLYYAGSHGFEIVGPAVWSDRLEMGGEFLPKIDEAERRLRARLAGIAGHAVERKRFSIAVHYRKVAETDVPRVEAAVEDVLSDFEELRMGRGKRVFRVQPNIDWDKGRAVLWLIERLKLDGPHVIPLYIGDDITDEDAFRALAGRGVCLVVRDPEDRPTAADYALADPDDVMRFLKLLTGIVGGSGDRSRKHG